MERWDLNDVNFLKSNYLTMSYKDIATKLDKTEGAIRAKCFDLKLIKNNRWSEYEINYIKENLYNKSYKEIALDLNRTENAVKLKAEKMGIKKSPYHCNYRFFSNIDSEDKAYWLGFIFADGWINENVKTNSGYVGIQLQLSDINHLRKFNKSIDGNYNIVTGESTCKISNTGRINKYCKIVINSIDMVNDLKKYGINNRKSYSLSLPNIDDDLFCHFLRGYFDGDGCVRQRKRWRKKTKDYCIYPVCDISSNVESFLEELRSKLYTKGINSYIYVDRKNFRIYPSGLESNLKFLKYIYENATVYLDRKFQKYKKILQDSDCLAS